MDDNVIYSNLNGRAPQDIETIVSSVQMANQRKNGNQAFILSPDNTEINDPYELEDTAFGR